MPPRGIFVPSRPRAQSRDENERLLRDQALLERLGTAPTPDVILSLLSRGQSLGAIHADGIRVALTSSGLRLRLRDYTGYSHAGLAAEIETDEGRTLGHCEWASREPMYVFLERLGRALAEVGEFFGPGAIDQRLLIARLADAFDIAITSSTLDPHLGFRPLIEVLGPQWLLTGFGMECREVRLAVPVYEYADPGWRLRVGQQVWADLAEFDAARALMGRLFRGRPELFRGARALR